MGREKADPEPDRVVGTARLSRVDRLRVVFVTSVTLVVIAA